jgi:hypothetical protein
MQGGLQLDELDAFLLRWHREQAEWDMAPEGAPHHSEDRFLPTKPSRKASV